MNLHKQWSSESFQAGEHSKVREGGVPREGGEAARPCLLSPLLHASLPLDYSFVSFTMPFTINHFLEFCRLLRKWPNLRRELWELPLNFTATGQKHRRPQDVQPMSEAGAADGTEPFSRGVCTTSSGEIVWDLNYRTPNWCPDNWGIVRCGKKPAHIWCQSVVNRNSLWNRFRSLAHDESPAGTAAQQGNLMESEFFGGKQLKEILMK